MSIYFFQVMYSKTGRTEKILSKRLSNGEIREIQNKDNKRQIITYSIFKELERRLILKKAKYSAGRAVNLTRMIYSMDFVLPELQKQEMVIINMDEEQKLLCKILDCNVI